MRTEVLKRLQNLHPNTYCEFTLGINEPESWYYYELVCSPNVPENSRILLRAARKYYKLVVL